MHLLLDQFFNDFLKFQKLKQLLMKLPWKWQESQSSPCRSIPWHALYPASTATLQKIQEQSWHAFSYKIYDLA